MIWVWLLVFGCATPVITNPWATDDDGDGLTEYDGDCDDADSGVARPATGCDDADSDGYRVADGDCDDRDDQVSPAASEICGNGVDDDCDGYAAGCGAWSPRSIREAEIQIAGTAGSGHDGFGQAIAAGDLDRDGAVDLVVASMRPGIRLFRGPLVEGRWQADSADAHWELDGAMHLAIGYAGDRSFVAAATESGEVHIFTGDAVADTADTADTTPADEVVGDASLAGEASMALADLDGDGLHELMYAVAGEDTVAVLRGPPKSQPWEDGALFFVGATRSEFGSCVAGFDLDEDGYGDLFVGAPDEASDDGPKGAVFGFSGPVTTTSPPEEASWRISGAAEATLVTGDYRLGERCWVGPDITGDGAPDLLTVTKSNDAALVGSGLDAGSHTLGDEAVVMLDLISTTPFAVSPARASTDALPRIVTGGTFLDGEDTKPAAWLFHGPFAEGDSERSADAITYVDDEARAPATATALADLDGDGTVDFVAGFPTGDDDRGRVGIFIEGEGP